jgi:hypothetical protein
VAWTATVAPSGSWNKQACLHIWNQLLLETNVKDFLIHQVPVNPELGFSQSLATLNSLFADDDPVDSVGHRADIVPEIFFGAETVKSLRLFAHQPEGFEDRFARDGIDVKTAEILRRYRYVVVGMRPWGQGPAFGRSVERVILRGPFVSRHELVQPHSSKLSAAELWRFRTGLLNSAQAKALCVHLNSFRRTSAHGEVMEWSICLGPDPDGDVGQWLAERDSCGAQLHRSADDLAGFGLDGSLGSRITSFKLAPRGCNPGHFSYLPSAPVIEPLYSIECMDSENRLVDGYSISVTLSHRNRQSDSKKREAILEFADYAGAFPEFPVTTTGLQFEHYYFLADEEWTGVPLGAYEPRPNQHAATLFTATEALHVMKRLHHLGFKRIRRVQDLKAYSGFGEGAHDRDSGVMLCSMHSLPELGVTILFQGLFKFGSMPWRMPMNGELGTYWANSIVPQ